MATPKVQTEFRIVIARNIVDRRYVLVTVRRCWFNMVQRSSESRLLAETWMDASGMTENETLAAALKDLSAALSDSLG